MRRTKKAPEKVDTRPGEGKLENLPLEWTQEDRKLEGRKPDLGEDDEDPSER